MTIEQLPARLRTARKDAGLSQESLAEAVEVSAHAVYLFERGKNRPALDTLERIADATGKPLAWFFRDEGAEPPAAAVAAALRVLEAAQEQLREAQAGLRRALGEEDQGKMVSEPAPAPYAATQSLGDRLFDLVREARLEPTGTADALGIDRDRYQDILGSQVIPTTAELRAIAGAVQERTGEDHLLELLRLRRDAPARQLAHAAEHAGELGQAARTVRNPRKGGPQDPYVLHLTRLDPRVKAGLSTWCREMRGEDSDEVLAEELRRAQEMEPEERRAWSEAVSGFVALVEE